jgi:serine/threonine protein kinase
MAPECLCGKEYNMKADVYSFAIILWEILTGRTPYGCVKGISHLMQQIVEEHVRPSIDESWPSSIQGLLEISFDSEIGKRPVSPCLIEMHVATKFSHSSASSA